MKPLVNGNPLIGVWYQPVSSFAKWKSRGINTLFGYESESGTVSLDAYCTAAATAGLTVLLQWAPASLSRIKADPNVIGVINQPDEPDGVGNTPPATMLANYQAIKAQTSKPVFLNVDGRKMQWLPASTYAAYAQAADALCFDYYVLNYGEPVANFPNLTARAQQLKAAGNGKPVIAIIECSNQDMAVQAWCAGTPVAAAMRGPTAAEFQQEVAAALAGGVDGVAYFPDVIGTNFVSFDGVPADVAAAMTAQNAQLLAAPASAPSAASVPPATPVAPAPTPTTTNPPGHAASGGNAPAHSTPTVSDAVLSALKASTVTLTTADGTQLHLQLVVSAAPAAPSSPSTSTTP